MTDEQLFATAFIEAALFADAPEGYEGKDGRIGLASDSAKTMRDFAQSFYHANEADIAAYPKGLTQAGHDLWFTINGHGVGYWENFDDVSKRLDAAATALQREGGLYEGDDGLLYWF
jgi:hypothetical protein